MAELKQAASFSQAATSITSGSPADSFPVLSPPAEKGWVAGLFDLLSKVTGYSTTPRSMIKPGQREAKRHGAMGIF
ncbi:hypothetical protein FRB96_008531 [Tulasnella sp. 330]|nr:hypothetical protein FRB96_008531 [Tulasnella sp. 330]KAG8879408.1 hypothetical protein FRB97_001635 [Tulasnella sp. 331]